MLSSDCRRTGHADCSTWASQCFTWHILDSSPRTSDMIDTTNRVCSISCDSLTRRLECKRVTSGIDKARIAGNGRRLEPGFFTASHHSQVQQKQHDRTAGRFPLRAKTKRSGTGVREYILCQVTRGLPRKGFPENACPCQNTPFHLTCSRMLQVVAPSPSIHHSSFQSFGVFGTDSGKGQHGAGVRRNRL